MAPGVSRLIFEPAGQAPLEQIILFTGLIHNYDCFTLPNH